MITQEYKLNLIPDNFPVFVRCSQYDTESRTIEMTLYEGSALYTIPNGATVTVRGTKQDGTGFEYPCTFSGSVVSFDIQAQMTIFAGKVPSEIRITSNGEILGSCNFYFLVESTPLDSSTVISESDLPLFEQVAQELPQAIEDIEWLKENINKVYGIKRSLTTSSSAWERTNDSVGLNANATFDGTDVVNDFDNLYPWSKIKTVNMADNGTINAQIGDVNFKFDGTNGEVMTYIPPFYWKRWQDSSYEYIQISNNYFDGASFSEGFYVGRYTTSSGHHSYSGVASLVNTNITTFRTNAKAKGTGWGQMDYHYFLLQMLYLVEYADNNSQAKLGNGISSVRYVATDTATVAETSVNRIIIATDNSAYEVGTYINIGTSQGGTQVASMRKITSKETVTDGTAINFDGTSVNIAVGNVLWGGQQLLGECDSLGMKSGTLNDSGRHAMIYRGIENLFGNIFQFMDGLNIKDNVAYICYDQDEYTVNKFTSPYEQIGYTNATSNNYAKQMGYDSGHPLVGLPVAVQSNATTTYYCDYYYQNTGDRIARVGGDFSGGANAGVFYWLLNNPSGDTYISFGSRLLRKTVQ